MRPYRPLAAGALLLLASWPAAAQNGVGADISGYRSQTKLPELKPRPDAWPRLDPGAVLCRTEDDLRRHGVAVATGSAGGPVNCRLVQSATPISIVQRAGPGATQVRLSAPPGDTGWTDAFLPDKAPAGH